MRRTANTAPRTGSRARLNAAFISALEADWALHGEDALEKVRSENPTAYARLAAELVPKQIEIEASANDFDGQSKIEIEEALIQMMAADLERFGELMQRAKLLANRSRRPLTIGHNADL